MESHAQIQDLLKSLASNADFSYINVEISDSKISIQMTKKNKIETSDRTLANVSHFWTPLPPSQQGHTKLHHCDAVNIIIGCQSVKSSSTASLVSPMDPSP